MMVFSASMGMRAMRNAPAAADANPVFAAIGRPRVASYASSSARVPVLAAVSPNRESGA